MKRHMQRLWHGYCVAVAVALYAICYFGTMMLTLHSKEGYNALREFERALVEDK